MVWLNRDSVATAKEVLDGLFVDKKKDLHPAFAQILCFLSDRADFEKMYHRMSEDVRDMYQFRRGTLELHNNLTAAFEDMFVCLDRASGNEVGCGFRSSHESIVVLSNKAAQNITLTGNAFHVFAGIVGNGYLFKDGTGPSHGEYAHTIQWLVIAYAKYYGRLTFKNAVVDLYKNAVGLPLSKETIRTLDADTDGPLSTKLPYWSLLVDCFRSSELHGEPESFGKNLFVENYRSPAYLTDQMLHRRLSESFLGRHLQERYRKRQGQGFVTGKKSRVALREHYLKKQWSLKQALKASGETTNATIPRRLEQTDESFVGDFRKRVQRGKGQIA